MVKRKTVPAKKVHEPTESERTWVTGRAADRGGLSVFLHLIRSTSDPDRRDIRLLPEHLRDRGALWRRGLMKQPPWSFCTPLLELLQDGVGRTFNRMGVELMDKTADNLFQTPPEQALWWLVAEQLVEHSMETPILFRITNAGREALAQGRSFEGVEMETPSVEEEPESDEEGGEEGEEGEEGPPAPMVAQRESVPRKGQLELFVDKSK